MDAVQRVKNMVRHSLIASPGVTNKELYARAREIAPQAVEGLSLRQFHARFRLPVMVHEMGPRRKRERRPAEGGSGGRAARAAGAEAKPSKSRRSRAARTAQPTSVLLSDIREILVEFAVKLEKAESRSDLVRVMGGLDDFAARILRTVQAEGKPAPAKVKAKAEADGRADATGTPARVEEAEVPATRTAA